jgi:hypothetical protein
LAAVDERIGSMTDPTAKGGAQVSDPSRPVDGQAGAAPDRGEVTKHGPTIDLETRREQLAARVAELQWDLGGLVYEMAVRDRIRVDVIVKRAAQLQDVDAELSEIERILTLEQSATAGTCGSCQAPHSSSASYCWQCGQPILRQVDTSSILSP